MSENACICQLLFYTGNLIVCSISKYSWLPNKFVFLIFIARMMIQSLMSSFWINSICKLARLSRGCAVNHDLQNLILITLKTIRINITQCVCIQGVDFCDDYRTDQNPAAGEPRDRVQQVFIAIASLDKRYLEF